MNILRLTADTVNRLNEEGFDLLGPFREHFLPLLFPDDRHPPALGWKKLILGIQLKTHVYDERTLRVSLSSYVIAI